MTAPATTFVESFFTRDPDRLKHFVCQTGDEDDPTHSVCGTPILGIDPPAEAKACQPCIDYWVATRPSALHCKEHR